MAAEANVKKYAVSMIGLGNMGYALAKAFLEKQHRVTVWNRTASKAEPLAANGAKVAESIPEAIRASDVLVVCVLNYATFNDLFHTEEAAKELGGKVLIQLTTGTPRDAREGAAWAAEKDFTYLDGAILDEPGGVGQETFAHLYSGPKAAFDDHVELLKAFGSPPTFVGEDPSHAAAFDCSLLSFLFSCELGFVHGGALAASEGVDINTYHEMAQMILKRPLSPMMTGMGTMMAQRKYPGDVAKLKTYNSATALVVQASKENAVDTALPLCIESVVNRANDAGHGESDFSAIFEVLSKQGGGDSSA